MDIREYDKFMQDQVAEIQRYRLQKEKEAGHPLGNDIIFEWIANYSEEYRKKWIKSYKKSYKSHTKD
jgi:hypothetical protein